MRTAITQGAQLGRSTVAGVLALIVSKLAVSWSVTAPLAQELSILTFLAATQLGMWARNNEKRIMQWIG